MRSVHIIVSAHRAGPIELHSCLNWVLSYLVEGKPMHDIYIKLGRKFDILMPI